MNWPRWLPGGPWASESLTRAEAKQGSVFGWGVIDNPFGRTEAEERLSLARHRNIVRAQARDSFNGGATWDTIAASLKADNPAYIPEDLRQHYRL